MDIAKLELSIDQVTTIHVALWDRIRNLRVVRQEIDASADNGELAWTSEEIKRAVKVLVEIEAQMSMQREKPPRANRGLSRG